MLAALRDELTAFFHSKPSWPDRAAPTRHQEIAVPLRLKSDDEPLSFFSATTAFGTAVDVMLSEVAIEAFFPAEKEIADAMVVLDGWVMGNVSYRIP